MCDHQINTTLVAADSNLLKQHWTHYFLKHEQFSKRWTDLLWFRQAWCYIDTFCETEYCLSFMHGQLLASVALCKNIAQQDVA